MNIKWTRLLVFLTLLASGCGKNNQNNTTTPSIPPVNGNPVYTNPGGSPVDISALREILDVASLNKGVVVGDYFDEVSTNAWTFNFNINFFGKDFGTSSFTPKRYKVVSSDANFVDLELDGKSGSRNVDRSGLMEKIFSDSRSDITPAPSRACVQTLEYGTIPATLITKLKEYRDFYGRINRYPVERVIVAPSIPLYLNPIYVESQYKTTFIRRFKVGSKVTNIIKVGPCN